MSVQNRWWRHLQQQQQRVTSAAGWDYNGDEEGDEEDEDGEGNDKGAITIRISTGVRVSGDENFVCLPPAHNNYNNGDEEEEGEEEEMVNNNNGNNSSSSSSTGVGVVVATNAQRIAEAVTAAIRQGGEQEEGGIPMIDEEGRPRAIRVQIEAGVEVRGKGNVLGGEKVVLRALMTRRSAGDCRRGEEGGAAKKQKQKQKEKDKGQKEGEDKGGSRKRKRRLVEEQREEHESEGEGEGEDENEGVVKRWRGAFRSRELPVGGSRDRGVSV